MIRLERRLRKLLGRDWESAREAKPQSPPREVSLEICSTYCRNVPTDILEGQARVFEHLGLPLRQVEFGGDEADDRRLHRGHGETLEHLIRESAAELLIFFDVDCIPLNRGIVEHGYVPVMLAGGLIGPMQRANHIGNFIYAAPSAFGFAKSLYDRVGQPPLTPSKKFDVCGSLTHSCQSRGIPVVKLPPERCVVPKWSLYDDSHHHYGHGTTYSGGIFHSFEIRLGSTREMFIAACEQVLSSQPAADPLPPIHAVLD